MRGDNSENGSEVDVRSAGWALCRPPEIHSLKNQFSRALSVGLLTGVLVCGPGLFTLTGQTLLAQQEPQKEQGTTATVQVEKATQEKAKEEKAAHEKHQEEKTKAQKAAQSKAPPHDNSAKGKNSERPLKEQGSKESGAKDVGARNSSKPTNQNAEKTREKSNPKSILKGTEVQAEQEAGALAFASQHHPELVSLLSPLKTVNPGEYQRAIRDLFRTSERLDLVRMRDQPRYELELQAWKLNSKVRLLAARLLMETDPELEGQLKSALREKIENKAAMLRFEQESLQRRLAQIERDLETTTKSMDQAVTQEYDRLVKRTNRDKPLVPKARKNKKLETKSDSTKSDSTKSDAKQNDVKQNDVKPAQSAKATEKS